MQINVEFRGASELDKQNHN